MALYFILFYFLFQLDGRVDSIEVKIKKLDAELSQCRDKMSRLPENSPAKSSIKQQAMRILQQKRMYENQRGMMMQQSFNMEQTNFATESVKDTVTVLQAMKSASKDMKKTMRKLDISQIEVFLVREYLKVDDNLFVLLFFRICKMIYRT